MPEDRKKKNIEKTDSDAVQDKATGSDNSGGHPWESILDEYPLRQPEEDPAWAVRTVKIWMWIAIASGLFILALIILGFFFD